MTNSNTQLTMDDGQSPIQDSALCNFALSTLHSALHLNKNSIPTAASIPLMLGLRSWPRILALERWK